MSKTDALLSKGVMQGDPLSMLIYASSTLPLIKSLYNPSTLVQNWYADDSSCAAKLPHLLKWFQRLCELGPKYGYYPEPKKTILIVDPTFKDEANVIFQPFGISVVSDHRFLGGFIGGSDSTRQFVQSKVTEWISCIMELSKAAEKYPQAAFSVLSKSLQFEWTYLQRVVSDCSAAFAPVWDALNTFFLASSF